jgi:uncharacterized protein YkwD
MLKIPLNLRALVLAFFLFSLGTSLAFALTDISGHRYEEAIEFLVSENVVGGYEDESFRPDNTLNRAELLKIVIEAVYEDEFATYEQDTCYNDVSAGAWFTPYVCFASAEGIVQGYEGGEFRPAQEVNFVEALKIILLGFGTEVDVSGTDLYWYKPYVDHAHYHHFIPLDIETFDQDLSRAQASEMLTRMLKSEGGELLDYLGEDFDIMPSYLSITFDFDMEAMRSVNEDLLAFINAHRVENGESELELDESLNEAAILHSRWMSDTMTLSHTGENDSHFQERCEAAGTTCWAENAAYNGLPSAEALFLQWQLSPGHNKNMLGDYSAIGIGVSGEYATTVFR